MNCFSLECVRCHSSKPRQTSVDDGEGIPSYQNFHVYSYKELKIATKGFRASNKIGEGGFGSVYKGKLKDGTLVAVKKLSAESRQGEREFMSEILAISNIRHESLVTLLGCCVDETHRILVYEYMENSSLAQTLLGGGHGGLNFNWTIRRGICLGVAHGLSYLHEHVTPRVVHRDIKASNILLDRYLSPKISDFGLAKLFPDDVTHISTRVAGTLGYLAPEYAIRGQLTRKADIYSFGILVLEVISGRCISDSSAELEGQHILEKRGILLVQQVWELFKAGEFLDLVDPILNKNYPYEEAFLFLKVALLCVQEAPSLRPQISTVMKMMLNEMDISDIEISRPGFITDFMALKTGNIRVSQSPFSRGSPGII